MKPLRLGILVSGRGSNLQALLDAADAGWLGARVEMVVSDNPDAVALRRVEGRDVLTAAVERRAYRSFAEFEAAMLAQLARRPVDLVVLAGFMRVLSPGFVARFPRRIINVHPSLLPAFPGLHAQRQALLYGVKISGCTVHYVDETLDGGPIIAQSAVPVLNDDTEETLSARILIEEHRLLPKVVRSLVEKLG